MKKNKLEKRQSFSQQDKKEIKKCPILKNLKRETFRGSLDIANLDIDLDLI